MKVSDFTYLLQNPDQVIQESQTQQLEEILKEFPYFQAARALHLKGLKTLNSYKYNNALKVAAAHTTDRDILFDFITSEEFLQNKIADTVSGKTALADEEIESEEVLPNLDRNTELIPETEDLPLPRSISDAEEILNPDLFESREEPSDEGLTQQKEAEESLQLGKPITFTRDEKYSFSEWLQLTSLKGVRKQERAETKDQPSDKESKEESLARKEKFELIDKFIEENPKIGAVGNAAEEVDISSSTKMDKKALMTETLAQVYLEQKKYKKAIQAYKILSLKYPEKSSFFADRIKAVKKLQKNKP
ncbi:hypothetical protein [Lentiprolixibacter aurantiacus]|uniref:Tetratricopeptide repeat protein n=1 Tax=Lentiprolixibacter aurantiacus TaxID=2993939 RepID=A0AAE3MJL1_9FLAO|nr:hypothetical protein [Lentiprolixibacter aurantiacus]MCX2718059.1 hypothetical protein [Lentiprolixibacter aurantiacus]